MLFRIGLGNKVLSVEYHSLPGGVNDALVTFRRRLVRKIPTSHVLEREASPVPKRRTWLLLPGPSRGYQVDSHFPRVGIG